MSVNVTIKETSKPSFTPTSGSLWKDTVNGSIYILASTWCRAGIAPGGKYGWMLVLLGNDKKESPERNNTAGYGLYDTPELAMAACSCNFVPFYGSITLTQG